MTTSINDELSDVYNANLFVDTFQGELKYSPSNGCWYQFDGVVWQRDELRYVMQNAIECTRTMLLDSAKLLISAATMRDSVKRDLTVKNSELLTKHAKSSRNKNRLDAMIAIASTDSRLAISQTEFDTNDMLIALKNGVVDLKSGKFRSATSSDSLTKQAGTNYPETAKDFECKLWLAFLEDVQPDPEVRLLLQRLAGYCLTGRTHEQVLTVFHGDGLNGKSVFVETLKQVLGSYAAHAQFESFCERGNDNGIRNDIARLDKVRLVVAAEGNEGMCLDEGLIKQLTGCDEITARFLHREYFTFTPKFKIILVTNHKPIIRGTDHGIWRRVLLVPWLQTIAKDKIDLLLLDKLAAEKPGILAWAIEGLSSYLINGLNPPKVLIEANACYRKDSDVVGLWIDECCNVGSSLRCTSTILLNSFNRWATTNGHREIASKSLGIKLAEKGFEKDRSTSSRGWAGLDIKSNS